MTKTKKEKRTGVQIFFTVLFLIIAILAILYGIAIFGIHSGSRFYMVWFAAAFFSLILAAFSFFGIFAKIPIPVRAILLSFIGIGLVVFLYTQIRILGHFKDSAPKNLDYIIVLGAQVRPDGPSLVLKYRLDTAADYLKDNPDTICIVSGGMGPNETVPEAYGMKDYLAGLGIDEKRILTEDASGNTVQNILFSKKLLSNPEADIGIVTNNFHVYRGLALARKQGLKNSCGISAPSSAPYLPNNMLREFVGIMKDALFGNINFF